MVMMARDHHKHPILKSRSCLTQRMPVQSLMEARVLQNYYSQLRTMASFLFNHSDVLSLKIKVDG